MKSSNKSKNSKDIKSKDKKKAKSKLLSWNFRIGFIPLAILLILLTLLMTLVLHPEYVRMSADLNPFVFTSEFFYDSMRQAGGLLMWTSRLLQSLFFYPWLGASVMALVLVGMALATWKTFKVSDSMMPLCFVAPLMILLNYTQLGYMIYVLKSPAPAMSMALGGLLVMLLTWVYTSLSGRWMRWSMLALLIVVGYPLMGFYGLLAAVLCLIVDAMALMNVSKKGRKSVVSLAVIGAVVVALLIFVPKWYFTHVFTMMSSERIYISALPDYYWLEDERWLWMPSITAFVFLSLTLWRGKSESKTGGVLALFMLAAAIFVVVRYTYNDKNFSNILKMSLATDRADWEEVLDVARDSDVPPTRVEVLFRNLALQKQGIAEEAMYKFEDGDAPYVAPRQYQYLRLAAARALYYYYGKVNYSYRWCMEDMVEYGMRPAYIEYMLRCAIVNEEPQLAEKYRAILSEMPFRSDVLGDYSPNDKESAMPLTSLMNYNDLLDGDAGLIEVYLLNNFALTEGGSKEMVNLSLQCCMILKDIPGFWPRFMQMLPTFGGKIPLHYQEAAILFSALDPRYDISELPLDAGVKSRFEQLVQESTANSALGDEVNAKRLKPAFGDTYWYYYFFVKGLKTN